MSQIKNIILFISLLFITLYIPLAYTIYSSNWYEINYNYQDTYAQLGYNETNLLTTELIGYFMHKNDLESNEWTNKEKAHFNDVRVIYDLLFLLFFLSIICLTLLFEKGLILKYTKINIYVISSLIIVLPFFSYFWTYIFHPLLFNNNLWIMTAQDISYYLFDIGPNMFFVRSFIFIIIISTLENIFGYYLSKK